jgi:hypothetical protein
MGSLRCYKVSPPVPAISAAWSPTKCPVFRFEAGPTPGKSSALQHIGLASRVALQDPEGFSLKAALLQSGLFIALSPNPVNSNLFRLFKAM